MREHFQGKLAIVTGAAQGIGLALSEELAGSGCTVVMVDIQEPPLTAAAEALRQQGGAVHPCVSDLVSDEQVEQLGEAVLEQLGVPDFLFNNAYVPVLGGVENIVLEDWRKALDVNVLGYVRIIKAFVGAMIERGSGHIMNTASPMGIMPDPAAAGNMLPYCSSKAADIGLSSALAAALQPCGIRVSVFFPDVTNTWNRQTTGSVSEGFTEALGRLIQSGATPQSAAQAMLAGIAAGKYLVSAEPGFEERLVRGAMAGFDPRAISRGVVLDS